MIENPPSVAVVLPCLDEAAAIPAVLRAVPTEWVKILVDNGSGDDSAQIARREGAVVVAEPQRGYGSAVAAGIRAATADIVAVMDVDGSIDPAEIAPLVVAVITGRCDLAVGRRRPRPGSWSRSARLANSVIARYLRLRIGADIHDLAPVRVARRDGLLALGVQDRRSGFPVETLVRAAHAGWRIAEFDVTYAPRTAGTRSKVTGTARGALTALQDIAGVIRRVSRAVPVVA